MSHRLQMQQHDVMWESPKTHYFITKDEQWSQVDAAVTERYLMIDLLHKTQSTAS